MGTRTDRIVTRYKAALELPNPLDGMRKQKATNYLYKLTQRYTRGIYSDQSWVGINRIFDVLRKEGIPFTLTDEEYIIPREYAPGPYHRQQMPTSKTWTFEIPFTNQRGRPDTIYGTITAAGAGSVDDPLDKYDITAIFG